MRSAADHLDGADHVPSTSVAGALDLCDLNAI
jgi:hypothetical protein